MEWAEALNAAKGPKARTAGKLQVVEVCVEGVTVEPEAGDPEVAGAGAPLGHALEAEAPKNQDPCPANVAAAAERSSCAAACTARGMLLGLGAERLVRLAVAWWEMAACAKPRLLQS